MVFFCSMVASCFMLVVPSPAAMLQDGPALMIKDRCESSRYLCRMEVRWLFVIS